MPRQIFFLYICKWFVFPFQQPKPVITKPKPMSEKPKPSPEKPRPATPPHQAEQRPSSPEHKTPVKAELDVQRAGNSGRSSPAMAAAAAQPPENAEPPKPTKVFTGWWNGFCISGQIC